MESRLARSEAKPDEARPEAAGSSGGGGSSSKVYHERQRMQFCLLHALNNLMQVTLLLYCIIASCSQLC
jgi:hypothetical protein